MQMPDMQLTNINGVDLEVHDSGGPGEPVVFVHGGMGDECFAVIQQPALTGRYRVVHYHRRGYGRSTTEGLPLTIQQQAADCRAVIGEASAAAPPLLEAGDIEGAMNTLFGVIAPGFRASFDETLPAGWYERWIEDCERVVFPHDLPALEAWQYTADDAATITAPVLNVTGAKTASFFTDIHETVQSWIPHAERAVVPDATHGMLEEQPEASAELLAGFFARHPMGRLRQASAAQR